MRVTFNSFPDTLLGRLQSLGKEQNKSLTQLSTGQRLAAPSDDAPAMQRILNLRTEKKQNQQFHRNAIDGLEKSKVTFSSLEQIKDLVVRASELSANINGATSEQEYKAKASEINQLIEQGLNVANTKLRGNYLFSGDSNSKIPFLEDRASDGKITSVSYSGSSSESKIHIGEGESASITVGSMAQENGNLAGALNELIRLRDAMLANGSSQSKADTVLNLRTGKSDPVDPIDQPTTTIIKLAQDHGLAPGDEITLTTLPSGEGSPLEMAAGSPPSPKYRVKSVNGNNVTLSRSDDQTNAAIAITSNITSGSKFKKVVSSGTSVEKSFAETKRDTITLPTPVSFKPGDKIVFNFSTGATSANQDLANEETYYVKSINGTSMQISAIPGGDPITFTQNISGSFSRVDGLGEMEDTILSALSRAGTIQYRLETAMKDLEVRYEGTEKLISTDADIDFAEATVRLNRAQMAYQAAIQSGARIQNNSLLDYLR
jgi:flagellar hook-associated protein 3 FlgL